MKKKIKKFKIDLDSLDVSNPRSKGKKLYSITTTNTGQSITSYVLGDDYKSAAKNFIRSVKWDKEFVMSEFKDVGWIYYNGDDLFGPDEESDGYEEFNVDYIGEMCK